MNPPLKRAFSLVEQPEVFSTTAESSAAIRRAVADGRARKLAGRIYTVNLDGTPEEIAGRNWQRIVALLFPGAVVVDRSAFEAKPAADGSLFLDAGPDYAGRRTVRLPGLHLRPRKGPGPSAGDMPYMDLFLSSRPRAFLDNMRASRARNGTPRTLSRVEVERELTRLIDIRGEDAIGELRDRARALAPDLDADEEQRRLDDLIGVILGTREGPVSTASAMARRAGAPLDPDRVDLFSTLQGQLLRAPLPERPEQPNSSPTLPFFEAYLSNWIEGTEFEVSEAEEIVFERRVPAERAQDAHDVLGTFDLVADPVKRRQIPADFDSFLDLLRAHHGQILERRPGAGPGSFKTQPNRAGGTTFVAPELVIGTLREGFRYFEPLPAGLPRAVFLMFLIAEVHPFADGNGRVARVFMNAALSAAAMQRIVIPLSFRDDYLSALRAMSRTANPTPLIRTVDFAQRYATEIDWSDRGRAQHQLEETNALVPPDEADADGRRLRLPSQIAG